MIKLLNKNLIVNILAVHLMFTVAFTLGVNLMLAIMTDITIMSFDNTYITLKAMFLWAAPITIIFIVSANFLKFRQ